MSIPGILHGKALICLAKRKSSKKTEEIRTEKDKPVEKKESLYDLFDWLASKVDPKSNVPAGNYPSKFVLECSESDPMASVICESLYNDKISCFAIKAKTAASVAKLAAVYPSLSKRFGGQQQQDRDFNKTIWEPIKKRHPEITERDKKFIVNVLSREQLEDLAGIDKTEKKKGLLKAMELESTSNDNSNDAIQVNTSTNNEFNKKYVYDVLNRSVNERCPHCPTYDKVKSRCYGDENAKIFKKND